MSDRSWPLRHLSSSNTGDGPRGAHYRIVCGKCGDDDFVSAQDMGATHPNIARKFARAGWMIGATGAADRCPVCAGPSAAKAISKGLPMVKTPSTSAPLQAPASPSAPSPAAAMKITEVYMALSDAYDLAARSYKAGWSDERIARDLGVSVELVARRREQDFGPVVVDTLGDDMRAFHRRLREEFDALDLLHKAVGASMDRHRALIEQSGRLADVCAARSK